MTKITKEVWFDEVYTPELIENPNFAGMLYSQHPEELKDNEIQIAIVHEMIGKDGNKVGFQFIVSALDRNKIKGESQKIWEEVKQNFEKLDESQEKYFLSSSKYVKDSWENKANLIGIRTKPIPSSFAGIEL